MNYRLFLFTLCVPLFLSISPILYKYMRNIFGSLVHTAQMSSTPSNRTIVVIGSGLAGLSAASQAIAQNVPVHMLERAPKPGGNSIKASSGINGAPTRFQTGVDNGFYSDTLTSTGHMLSNMKAHREKLISTLTKSSADAVYWLADDKGIDLSRVAQLGGHSFPRTHRGAGKIPPGAAIVTTLLKSLNESPLFQLSTSCEVTKLLKDGPKVQGVEYVSADGQTSQLHGPVVTASGGFGGDAEGLLAKYRPDLAGFPSTCDARPGSQKLLTDVGAQLLDMDQVQVHPTGFIDPASADSHVKFLAAEMLRGEGGILIRDGHRFVNEMDTREHITDVITKAAPLDSSTRQWNVELVLDEATYAAAKSHVDFYLWKGLMRKTTISELHPSASDTIREYSSIVSGATIDPFGRKYFGSWSLKDIEPDTVVYIGRVTPVVHFTMGGVLINEHSEPLDHDGKPIDGVWAAGEVTGGIHGCNRLGGSSLLECVVFGRTAGDRAAATIKADH